MVFLKWTKPGPFSEFLGLFKQTHNFYNKSMRKSVKSNQYTALGSNTQSLKHESSSIITRPRLPPKSLPKFLSDLFPSTYFITFSASKKMPRQSSKNSFFGDKKCENKFQNFCLVNYWLAEQDLNYNFHFISISLSLCFSGTFLASFSKLSLQLMVKICHWSNHLWYRKQ